MTSRSEETGTNSPDNRAALYQLVVVGSSAGGIEALSVLVATLPPDFPVPIVLAQHLDPDHPSHLAQILARRSALPVRTVTDKEQLQPGIVYVVPADRHVEITDHLVRLRTNGETSRRSPKPSVDRLLMTAARVYGEQLIAVILTGTGSDGAAGARAVKASGGLVLIENPATAAYPGMPESLAHTTVDFVADLAQIGPLLADLLDPLVPSAPLAPSEALEEDLLQAVLGQVREQSGIDFSRYKRPTILRRLLIRMVATGMRKLADYQRYLLHHPEEYSRLVASFLINVTEFFRDAALFTVLREQVLPDLIDYARTHGNELRFWSAGCATGDEAYSLAILLLEALSEEVDQFTIQIFATDLDEEAVAFARRGLYPVSSVTSVPQDLRSRYFTRLDRGLDKEVESGLDNGLFGSYQIKSSVRNLVIFGQHDLGQRAPFPRIDLVLCRNVLMYFTSELQQRVLHLFAFAVRDGGYLALGKAETIKPLEANFEPVHPHLTLYRRRGERVLPPIARMTVSPIHSPISLPELRTGIGSTISHMRSPDADPGDVIVSPAASIYQSSALGPQTPARLLAARSFHSTSESLGNYLLEAEVGVILVNHDYDIQMINSAARYLLGIYRVAVGNDLIHLTQNVSATALRMAIDAAFRLAQSPPSPQPEVELEYESEDSGYSDTIVTLETVQGERRHLQIACFPQRSAPSAQAAETPPSLEAKTASSAPVEQVLLVVSDVTRLVRRQQAASAATRRAEADRRQAESRDPGDLEQSYLAKIDEVERLRAQVAAISVNNRALVHANEELAGANLSLRSANDELLVGLEETESSAEEIKTLNEELQATNEELVTVNEELEATVEELHTSNEDLDGRSHELQRSAASLELQRQASEAARAQIEAILLSMGDALLVVDSHGIPTLTNATYARLFGTSDALIVAEDETGQRLPPNQQLNHLTASGAAFRSQFTLAGPDGTRRWFEAAGEPVRSSGIERGGVVTIRDVTERSLHHLQEEFLLRASHELRSPLTALLTALQLLAKGAQHAQGAAAMVDGSPTGQRNDLAGDRHFHQLIDVALRQVRRLRVLTNDLLDVGRLQQSKLDLHLEPVDLAEVVAQAVTVAQLEALQNPQGLTKQALILEVEAGSFTVLGDAVRLEQIILNLLTNAMKYAPDAERIEVRLRRWEEQAPVDEGNDVAPRKERPAPRRYAQLQVQDFGPGIAAEDLPHLFTRFFQSTYPNGAVLGGLGLGLYITRELVRAHDGGITVDSTLGRGTTFTVRLPLL